MAPELIWGMAVVFLGGVVQGCAGFGLALSTVPVLLLFLPHAMIPPVLVLVGLVNNLFVLVDARKSVTPGIVWPLMAGAAVCLPLGALVLKSIDPAAFRLGVGLIVVAAAIAMLAGFKLSFKPGWISLVPVGMLSGFLSGSTSLSGPPVILFFAGLGGDKQSFRGNLIAYFTLLNIASIITFFLAGLMTREVLVTAAWYLPTLVLGSVLGVYIARRINERIFRYVVLTLIVLIGISLVMSNIGSFTA